MFVLSCIAFAWTAFVPVFGQAPGENGGKPANPPALLGNDTVPSPEETLAFNAATRSFQLGVYDRAEKEFSEFVQKYPESIRAAEAVLFQARAALKQQKFAAAENLLKTNLGREIPLADQYRFCLGECYMLNTNYLAAAETFAGLVQEFPTSVRLLEACYGEANARFKLGQFSRVIALLQNPEGTFQKEIRSRQDELVVRGFLLLGEALLEQKAFRSAEETMSRLAQFDLSPQYQWQRQYLVTRMQAAERKLEPALSSATNLLALAGTAGVASLQAESLCVQAGILEQLNDLDAAIQCYTNNLAETAPLDYRRRALLKIIQLTLAQNRIHDAAQRLELFLNQHPEDLTSDVGLLSLGELRLKEHCQGFSASLTNVASPTNDLLQQASACFDRFRTNFPQSAMAGYAYLGKGWCYWEQGKIAESQLAFKAAQERLPYSEEQAVASFKLGDTFFSQKDLTNALQQYRLVVEQYSDLPRVKDLLTDQALYQILRCGIELDDLKTASGAMKKILGSYPNSVFAEPAHLLVGQAFSHARKPVEARATFREFARRYPDSPLLPEVELAVARSFVQERAWDFALQAYEGWLERFPTNVLRAQTEFNRAWVNYLAGRETNALILFTNFTARYASNELAPYAQYWVGDFFFRQKNFTEAEFYYQFTNWLNTPLAYQARMMAGRAAFARQGYKSAEDYFTALANDTNCPAQLAAQAFYALGDTILMGDADPSNPLKKFGEASEAFRRITQLFPNDRLMAAAWGRIGDCYFQMGSQDPKYYERSIEAYQTVLATTNHAGVAARSQAEAGWAKVLQHQAVSPPRTPAESAELLNAALNHYLNVFEGKILDKEEEADPFWIKETGLAAASLAEEQKKWEVAGNIYRRLLEQFPVLHSTLDKKIDRVREQSRPAKSS